MSKLIHTSHVAGDRDGGELNIIDGDGVHFQLNDGRKLLDASNTGGVLGHKHPDMVEAILKSAEKPAVNDGWYWQEREQAAEELIDIAFEGESDWVGGVRFFLSGGEANDLAVSLAQALSGHEALATRVRAYHGMTGISQHLTVQPHWHGGLAGSNGVSQVVPCPMQIRQIPEPLGAKYGTVSDNRPLSERLEGIETTLSGTASTIIDYTQGGIYYDPEYQDQVADAARTAGSLWIADEVVTHARSGRMFAFQGADSRPDIVTMGKGLAGGASPVGAVVLSKEIVDSMRDKSWQTYSTFRGHPLTIACVRAYLNVLKRDKLIDRIQSLENFVETRLIEIAKKHPSVARVDGNGLHWTVQLHGPDWRQWENNSSEMPIASRVSDRAVVAGAMFATSGEQTSIFLAPSFLVSKPELSEMLSALDYGLEVADEEYASTVGSNPSSAAQ